MILPILLIKWNLEQLIFYVILLTSHERIKAKYKKLLYQRILYFESNYNKKLRYKNI